MKKTTTKKVENKSVEKKFQVKTPTIYADIRNVNTDAGMVYELASAKLDAGRSVDVSEVANILSKENFDYYDLYKVVIDSAEIREKELRSRVSDLTKQLEWANRPWYKKLMFWKKKPEC